jgi:hypothetical protein
MDGAFGVGDAGRQALKLKFVVVAGKAELRDVVDALGAAGGLTSSLDGGQEQRHQDTNDRDDHEQFDERETAGTWMQAFYETCFDMLRHRYFS